MIEKHLEALKAALAGVATVYVVAVSEATPALPYLLIEPGPGASGPDISLCDESANLDLSIRLKAVAASPTAALRVIENAKARLSPLAAWMPLIVAGRNAELRWLRHEADYTDTQVALVATNRLVSLSVDSYRLVSTPA